MRNHLRKSINISKDFGSDLLILYKLQNKGMLRICTSFIFNRNLSSKLIIIFIISFQTTYYILLIFFLIINVNFHNGAPFTYQAGLNRQRTLNILNKNLDFKASYLSIIMYSKMFNFIMDMYRALHQFTVKDILIT